MINKTKKCPRCKGTGDELYNSPDFYCQCSKCHGTGTVKPIKKRMEKIKVYDWSNDSLTMIENKINEIIDAYNLDK